MKNDFLNLYEYMQVADYCKACTDLHDVGNEEEMRAWLKDHVTISEEIKEEAARIAQQACTDEEAGYIRAIREKNRDSGVKESVFDIRKRKLLRDLSNEREGRFWLWDKLFKEASKKLAKACEDFKDINAPEDLPDWLGKNPDYKGYVKEDSDFSEAMEAIGDALMVDADFVHRLSVDEEEAKAEARAEVEAEA